MSCETHVFKLINFNNDLNFIHVLSIITGCFFSTKGGLQSYEHPLNELKPVPRVDSKGEVLGVTYKVDAQTKKGSSMPRVGSAADWSSQY